jgi:hypothetical protein
VALGDRGQRHPRAAIFDHLLAINIQPCSTDLPTLKFCPSHACPNALHDQRPLKLTDGRDNYEHGFSTR